MPDMEKAREVIEKVKTFKFENGIPEVEEIQNFVEQVLIDKNYVRVAKACIIYRQKRSEIRKEKERILNKKEVDEVDNQIFEKRFEQYRPKNSLKELRCMLF